MKSRRVHSERPGERPALSWRRGYLWIAVFVVPAVAGGWFVWRATAPAPPEVKTDGFDPVIAETIRSARTEVLRSPRSARARGRLGMVLLAHELRAPARDCFFQAMSFDPREPRWPYFAGLAERVDHPRAAAVLFARAVELFPPGETVPRLRLADTLLTLGQLDEAGSQYARAGELQPGSALAALGLGKVANARDQPDTAASHLGGALKSSTTRKAAHRLLVGIHQRQGQTEEAARLAAAMAALPNDEPMPDPFLAAIEALKTGEEAWINQADEWIKAGRPAEAVRLLEKTLASFPRSDRAMFFLGRARLRLGDAAGAEAILARAVEMAPESIEAQLQLGIARLSRGRTKEAQPCFRAAIRAKPNLGEAWYNLALSLGAAADRPECIAAFREAIRLKPNLTEAYVGLATVLRADGQGQAAAVELKRALAIGPPEPLRQTILAQLRLVQPE